MPRKIGVVAAVVGVGFFACAANAAVVKYQMDVALEAEAVPMTKIADGYGDVAAGDFGAPLWAGLQDGTHGTAGTIRFVDSGSNGNDGLVLQGFAGGWTADLSIMVTTATGPGGDGRSIGVATANGAGRAIGLIPGTGDGFQFQVRSNFVMDAVDVPDSPSETTAFHEIRMVLPNNGHLLLYDLEDDLDPGPGYDWKLLMDDPNIGGSTGRPAELNNLGGIALNSLSGGVTRASNFSLDYMAVETGLALGAHDPKLIPEPATLALVVLGAAPLLRRRR